MLLIERMACINPKRIELILLASTHFFFSSFRAFSRSAGSVDLLPPDEPDSPNMSLVRSFTCLLASPAIQVV